jgi:transcriptional regulator with XRE-family HTH domain
MGEEYVALRKRYGLTQRQASKIFGKGLIAFSRYENEDSYPDTSTRLLIELAIAQPDILKTLADKAGVEISLWKEREEDRMQAAAKREEDKLQAEGKREKDRMREEAKRDKTRINEPQSINSKANMPIKDMWFALLSSRGRPYKYISGNYRQHSSIYKSSSVGCLAPLIETEWLECTKGWDLLNRNWDAPVEAQRYVFSDEPFSPFGDTNAAGDIEIGETAIGGGAA